MQVPAALRAPAEAYSEPLRVRSYEVGDTGTIGLGTLLRYLELLATDHSASLGFDNRWYERSGTAWFVRAMDLWLGCQPQIGADLILATWVSEFRRVQARREYAVTRADTGALVARASARWGYVDRATGHPRRMEDGLLAGFAVYPEHMLLPSAEPMPATPITSAMMTLTARTYEADTQGHINNSVYGDWLMEALRCLAREHPALSALQALRARRYRIEYVRPVRVGDAVAVATSAVAVGSRGLAVEQAITSAAGGAICLTARAICLRVP
jgi:acyl-CoA thioester hydrolase